MDLSDSPIYTGSKLIDKINSDDEKRDPYVDSFLYEKSVLMIAARSATGKSMLALQMAMQMTCCLPVFGQFYVHRPIKSLYLQMERPIIEIIERIRVMQKGIKPDFSNLTIDSSLQGLDLSKSHNWDIVWRRLDIIHKVFPFMVVFMDPIYAMVRGGLTKDDIASIFCQFSASLQNRYTCSNVLVHHLNRGVKDEFGNRSKGDMYGSVWLEAHPTGIFIVDKSDHGTKFKCEKDSHGNLIEKFSLEYDKTTHLSHLNDKDIAKLSGQDRLLMFLRNCERRDLEFSLDDIEAGIQLSTPMIYRLRERPEIGGGFIEANMSGKKQLWRWRDPRK